jgi:hypothetical protein
VAAAAYKDSQDKCAATEVRADRSCLLPLVPVAIPSLLLYVSGGSDGRKILKGGQGLKEVKPTTTMKAMNRTEQLRKLGNY